MIKDIFTLKKKSWHHYLMEFLWGLTYKNFPNMCPYFWLTVVNVIISPLAVPLWAIIKLIVRASNALNEYITRVQEENALERLEAMRKSLETGKPNKDLLILLKDSNWESLSRSERRKYNDSYFPSRYGLCNTYELNQKFHKLLNEREKLRDEERYKKRVAAAIAYHESIRKQQAARAKFAPVLEPIKSTAKSTQELIAYWVVGIKKAFKYIFWAIIGIVTFKTFYFLGALHWDRLPWDDIMLILFGMGIVIATAVVILLIGWGIWALIGVIYVWLADKDMTPYWLINFFKFIFKPLVWLVSGIGKLWGILMALKSDNCPGIDWE
jgi:hypothetical protein